MGEDSAIHVEQWGNGPRVVLVHGGSPGGGAEAFAAQQPLSERWNLVLPDRPAHGRTPRRGREDFERDANLLATLLEDGAHLLGHSYGGVVALIMAARSPANVRSLTLIEPPSFCFGRGRPAADDMARTNRELFEHPPTDPVQMVNQFFAIVGMDMALPDPAPEPVVELATAMARDLADIRPPDEAQIDASELLAGGYLIQVLTSGRTPGFEAIAAGLVDQTGARHVVVPDTDHLVQSAGAPVNDLLEKFWRQAEEASGAPST
jgi:pimeloyl-ACP methyl ester carboxylesterase